MVDIESKASDPVIQVEAPAGAAVSEVEPSRRVSVRDTIAVIEAELARHEACASAVSLSDVGV